MIGRYARAIHVEDRAEFYERIKEEEERSRCPRPSSRCTPPSTATSSSASSTTGSSSTPPRATGSPSRYYDVVGFYEHIPSGDYRLLCVSSRGVDGLPCPAWYHATRVGSLVMRCIERPISPAAPEDEGLGLGLDNACIYPPVQLRRNLHWPPQQRQGYHILVFDTTAEVFR
ncbi:hypothetical protein U9M48_037414 [Paspalum notatum var. saurae]|uniref:Uncharacterized protein n=1 Tax=Paspalum notatum var. saurae TaxID=547442 RepID=A0AAQ3XB13_PASNO